MKKNKADIEEILRERQQALPAARKSTVGQVKSHKRFPNYLLAILILVLLLALAYLYRFELADFLGLGHGDKESNRGQTETTASQTAAKASQLTTTVAATAATTAQPVSEQTAADWSKRGFYIDKQEFKPYFNSEEERKLVEDFFGPLPALTGDSNYQHNKLRALYANNYQDLDYYFNLAKTGDINALVIDAKEGDGLTYQSNLPLAKELGAVGQLDFKAVCDRCHEAGLKVIARIVCFKDPTIAAKRPDLCIQNDQGEPIRYPLEGDNIFASPYNQEVWAYLIDVAKEVIDLGADEIQFDYVRFPSGSGADDAVPYYGPPEKVPAKHQAINRFLQTAVIELQYNRKVPVGADLFSIIMTSDIDGQAIGQNWQTIGLTGLDNIDPMIYPSHYANDSESHYTGNGEGSFLGGELYTKPDLYPYGVVAGAIQDGSRELDPEYFSRLRPYLQAFTADYLPEGYYTVYDGQAVADQVQALADAGIDEWVLWNASQTYPSLETLK